MKLIIEGTPEEIAALVVAIQEQPRVPEKLDRQSILTALEEGLWKGFQGIASSIRDNGRAER